MTLNLILVECGLELIPKYIRDHPAIKKNLNQKNYSSQLLDNALHHSAMKKLPNYEKRGRPDITHACLLKALGSPANKSGNLKIYLHTFEKKIFDINSDLKISRNYDRFKGLMAKLLIENEIRIENLLLISACKYDLSELINSIKKKEIIILSSKGELVKNNFALFDKKLSKNYIVILGCFQKGFFSDEILSLSSKIVSISHYSLDAWVALSKLIAYYEISNDII